MRTWQAALIFAILIAVVLAISSNGAATIEGGVKATEISSVLIEPDDQPNRIFQQNDYGWGPVRLTD